MDGASGVVRSVVYVVYGFIFLLLAILILRPILEKIYPVSSRAYREILKAALIACLAAFLDQFYWFVVTLGELKYGRLLEGPRSGWVLIPVKGLPAIALSYLFYKVFVSGTKLDHEFRAGYSGQLRDVSAENPNHYKERYVIACMPFAKIAVANDVWELAIKKAADDAELKAHRADDAIPIAAIVDTVYTEIIYSQVVIADLTGANPNVINEIGWAQMLEKPLILIAQAGSVRLPAMLQHLHVCEYNPAELAQLSTKLASVLRQRLGH
jgi:hypothetical protein